MKPAAFTLILLAVMATAKAQLTLTPQIGFERTKICITQNQSNHFGFDPSTSLKASLRLDYKFKQGHGAFVGVSTSPSVMETSFTNPSSEVAKADASTGPLQWRLEAGYQFTTKAIRFSAKDKKAEPGLQRRNCSHFGCGAHRSGSNHANDMSLRLQPSIGFAYLPSIKENVLSNGNSYQYNAGNWKTGIVTGMGFEFGKGRERIMTLAVYYTKALGQQGAATINSEQNGKPVATSFSSHASSWGATIGVPFSLSKLKRPVAHRPEHHRNHSCQGHRCIRTI